MRSDIVVLLGAALASAQSSSSMSISAAPAMASSASYSTSIWDDCTDGTDTFTLYDTLTSTYCPHCTMTGMQSTYTTIYTTVWSSWCPPSAGVYVTPVPYTCTESWTGASTPPWSANHVPAGMTTQTHVCHVCEATPVTSVMTFPATCSSWMPGISTVAASTTPAAVATPAPAPGTTMMMNPAAAPPQQSNYVATPTPACVGDGCPAPTPTMWGNTTGITPFQGGAPALTIGATTAAALAVGVLVGALWL